MAAEIGNKYAQEWTLENALPRFEDTLKFALDDEKNCLCMQEAVMQSGIPSRTFYQLSKDHKVLQDIRAEINDAIIIRVNRGAMKGDLKETSSIFRMKQLGERDKLEIDHTTAGESFNVKPFKFRRSE